MVKIYILLLSFVFSKNNSSFNYLPKHEESKIISHFSYTLNYNEMHEQASWVAYRLTGLKLQNPITNRIDNFRTDPKIITGSATLSDYKGSGYDRGHLAPAADFKWSSTAMNESFFMSNMSPQLPGFNRGIWKNLESTVRNWAVENEEIYVITGPILDNPLGSIGKNRVSIPSHYYKVILDYKEPEIKALGIIIPNRKLENQLKTFVVSVDEIENLTGIDFFPELPDNTEKLLESSINSTAWSWVKSKSYTTRDLNYKNKMETNNSKRLPAGSSIQCLGNTKAGKRCKRKTLNYDGYCNSHRIQTK